MLRAALAHECAHSSAGTQSLWPQAADTRP